MMEEDRLLETNKDYLVTESKLHKGISIDSLLALLHLRKSNAHVNIVVNNGGVAGVTVTERTKAGEKQSQEIRRIMNME